MQALTHSLHVQQHRAIAAGADADLRLAVQSPPYLSLFEESVREAGVVGEITTPSEQRG
ncbi:MAG TPA: hypothetical protein VGC67_03980 [Cellulomonas sp.]